MFNPNADTQDVFRTYLVTVVGQAYNAAGYYLVENALKWASGQYRFVCDFDDGATGMIEYQLLNYVDTEWSGGAPSRFRVMLAREGGDLARRRDLSALVVADFGVAILPSSAHWWTFRTPDELGNTLAEAGHLVIGYGLPWLSGELSPDRELSPDDDPASDAADEE